MSKQSLRKTTSVNQKVNRTNIDKYNLSISRVTNKTSLNAQEQIVQNNTQNTLRNKVDERVFMKTLEEKELLRTMKSRTKHIKL